MRIRDKLLLVSLIAIVITKGFIIDLKDRWKKKKIENY